MQAKITGLTQSRLKELLSYDKDTGLFKRLTGQFKGRTAGWIAKDGYRYLHVDGQNYLAHRLAWLYETGEFPIGVLDHIDRNKRNEAFSNLRDCSNSDNTVNSTKLRDNKSTSYKGVRNLRNGSVNKFAAQIGKDGKSLHLGVFPTPEAAAIAYNNKAKELFGEFVVLNKIETGVQADV